MRFTIYKNSALATVCSIIGMGLAAIGIIGIITVIGGEEKDDRIAIVVFSVISILAGFGLQVLASNVAEKEQCKSIQKKLTEQGYDRQIAADVNAAIQVYNAKPAKEMLRWIESLNPQAGQLIRQHLAAQKQQKKGA